MRFSYVANEALDHASVQTIHVDAICSALARLGHEVRLYAPEAEGFRASETYASSFLKVPGLLSAVFFQLRLFLRLWIDMRRGKPDVIYSRHELALFAPALFGKLFGVPVVLEVNGPLLEEWEGVDHSPLGRALMRLKVFRRAESFSVRNASRLVVVAAGIEDYLVREYAVDPEKVSVVANGVDAGCFKPLDQEAARAKLGLEQDAVYVGYIGSLYPWQGLRYIVEAAALILADRDDVRFLILGKGDELTALAALVEESGVSEYVMLVPPVPHERVPEFVNALDICLCYPTRFRANATSPFKVYEYLACGKAVISADIEGLREAFGDALDYAEPESASALAERIGRLLDDKNYRDRLGADGLALVQSAHTWDRIGERIVTVSEEACR